MPAAIKIPTQFTAVDKFSHVIKGIGRNVGKMANQSMGHIKRFDHRMNRTFKQMGRLSQLAIGVGIGTLFYNATDDVLQYGDALAQFRTIVSDLNDKDFAQFEKGILNVAKDTKKSAIDVAASFEKIAGLNSKFAESEKGISSVSKAVITLSKASKDDLGTSAENLVSIMNQYSFGAEQADRAINVLASGQAVGAASITQTAESFKNYGSVAASANISLEQSVGLIQTLGKFTIFGAEAGTKLRGVTLRLQKAGMGYASGQFSINDALEESRKRMEKITSARQKDAFMQKTFGAENISVGKILMANIKTFDEFTNGVTGTSEAQKAASINSNTLANRLQELKNSFSTNIIETANSGDSLNYVKDALVFVANNIETVTSVGIGLLGTFAGMKALIWGTQAALVAYNVVLGIQGALSGAASIAIGKNAIALGAYNVVTWLATTATTAFGVAMNLGLLPILLIVGAIAGLIALFYNWDSVMEWFGKQWGNFTNWIGEAWNDVVEWFQEFDFMGFFKDIGQSILKFVLAPMSLMLEMASKIPGGMGEMAKGALGKIADITGEVRVKDNVRAVNGPSVNMANAVNNLQETTMKGSLDINLNDPGKMVESTKTQGNMIPIKVTPTQGVF